MINLIRSLGKK